MNKQLGLFIFIVLFCVLFSLTIFIVRAGDGDIHKNYNETSRVMFFSNSSNFGETVATVQLLSEPHRYIFVGDYVFELKFYFPEDYDGVIDSIDFYNVNADMSRVDSPNFELKYYDPLGTYEEIEYDYNVPSKNETPELIGSHNVTKNGTWIPLNVDYDFPKGELIVRGYYPDLKEGETIEWIPTMFGIELKEWADFTAYTKYEWYEGSADDIAEVRGDVGLFYGQTFTVGTTGTNESFAVRGVAIYGYENGDASGWSLDVNILGTIQNGTPDFSEFHCSASVPATEFAGSNAWYNVTIDGCPDLNRSQYYIYLNSTNSTSANCYRVARDNTSPSYAGGQVWRYYSSAWLNYTEDYSFEVWGNVTPSAVAPEVFLNVPANNTNQSSDSVTFNCTATDDVGVLNVSLYIDNVLNYTKSNSSAGQNLSFQQTLTVAEGSHNWTCNAYDGTPLEGTNNTRAFLIDYTSPTFTDILPPVRLNETESLSIDFNATDSAMSVCSFYIASSPLFSIGASTGLLVNDTVLPEDAYEVVIYVNDTLNNANDYHYLFDVKYSGTSDSGGGGDDVVGEDNSVLMGLDEKSYKTVFYIVLLIVIFVFFIGSGVKVYKRSKGGRR